MIRVFERPPAHAREARELVEKALDRNAWPWKRGLSLWIDALVMLEERGR